MDTSNYLMDTSNFSKFHIPNRYRLDPVPGATVDDLMTLFSLICLEIDQAVYDRASESLKRHFQLIDTGEFLDRPTSEND